MLATDPMFKDAVSTHSRLKAAGCARRQTAWHAGFNTQPPEGGCSLSAFGHFSFQVSTHSRLKAAEERQQHHSSSGNVSTHSRLKAAGLQHGQLRRLGKSFKTQPPEGGCRISAPPRLIRVVSTHSRLKAAVFAVGFGFDDKYVSTHSRLKAADARLCHRAVRERVSTHSRLKAAAAETMKGVAEQWFQHTAA